ncbi:MAG: hypothetical protein R3310_01785 [Candidatus Competibacteraceae bacterium]|nr:hypothetical protein [Candidatus Competibacteraceae bacterium]
MATLQTPYQRRGGTTEVRKPGGCCYRLTDALPETTAIRRPHTCISIAADIRRNHPLDLDAA